MASKLQFQTYGLNEEQLRQEDAPQRPARSSAALLALVAAILAALSLVGSRSTVRLVAEESFGAQVVGTRSDARPIIIRNNGAAPVQINTVAVDPDSYRDDFPIVRDGDSCTEQPLGPGESCTVEVRFAPAASRTYKAKLVFTPNLPGTPEIVRLSGTGVPDGLNVSLRGQGTAAPLRVSIPEQGGNQSARAPFKLDFGEQQIGTLGESRSVIVRNSATNEIQINTVTVKRTGSDFHTVTVDSTGSDFPIESDGCSNRSLAPLDGCTIAVLFTPADSEDYDARLTITPDLPAEPLVVELNGTGVRPLLSLSFGAPETDTGPRTPLSLDLGEQQVGSITDREITLASGMDRPLKINEIAISAGNASDPSTWKIVDDSCSRTILSPEQSECKVRIRFAAAKIRTYPATLTIASDAPESLQRVLLTGTGTRPPLSMSISPPETGTALRTALSLDFGEQLVGTRSERTVVVRNEGTEPVEIQTVEAVSQSGKEFRIEHDTCSHQSLEPLGRCAVRVSFIPSVRRTFEAELRIRPQPPQGLQVVSLRGGGTGTLILILGRGGKRVPAGPAALDFGEQQIRTRSEARSFVVRNDSTAPIRISAVRVVPDSARHDFPIDSDGCSRRNLGPSETCRLEVGFAPGETRPYGASLMITPFPPEKERSVKLTGTGSYRPEGPGGPVIVRSISDMSEYPLPGAELLSGNPTYTVYLEIPGARRRWILQYCLSRPVARSLDLSRGFARIHPERKLNRRGLDTTAMEVPTRRDLSDRVWVYAAVDEGRTIHRARIIRGTDEAANQRILRELHLRSREFLRSFPEWEPVRVEVIIGIPLS